MDFAPLQDHLLAGQKIYLPICSLHFRMFLETNVLIEICKESKSTVGLALLCDRVLAGQNI